MATHSSILAWRIPWTEESGRLQSMGVWQRHGHKWAINTHTHTHIYIYTQFQAFLVWYYPWIPPSNGDLGRYPLWVRGNYCMSYWIFRHIDKKVGQNYFMEWLLYILYVGINNFWDSNKLNITLARIRKKA